MSTECSRVLLTNKQAAQAEVEAYHKQTVVLAKHDGRARCEDCDALKPVARRLEYGTVLLCASCYPSSES
jgi:hypothetical protein